MCAFACLWNKAHIQFTSWSMVIRVTGWSEWIQEFAKSAWPVQMLNFGIWMALYHLLMSSFKIKVLFSTYSLIGLYFGSYSLIKNYILDTAKKIADFGLRSACYGHLLCVEGMRKVCFPINKYFLNFLFSFWKNNRSMGSSMTTYTYIINEQTLSHTQKLVFRPFRGLYSIISILERKYYNRTQLKTALFHPGCLTNTVLFSNHSL